MIAKEADDRKARDFTVIEGEITRAADWREDGLWIIVLTLGGRNFCTYIGIPLDHPLAGYDYDLLPVDAHGGLTFADAGDGKHRPGGYYWYGWDYGHYGDFSYWNDGKEPRADEHDWTIDEVKQDAWKTIYDMKYLKTLAEQIYNKSKETK